MYRSELILKTLDYKIMDVDEIELSVEYLP